MRSTSVNFFLKPSFSSNDLYITWLKIILTDQVCLKFVETHVFFFHFLPVLEFLTTNFSPCENLFKELFPRNHLAHRFLGYILILKGLYTSITQHPTISTWSRHDPECEVGILWWLHAPQAGDSQGEDICEPPDGNLELIEHSDFRWFCSILLMDKILPIFYRVLTIPGGAGFLQSTVWPIFSLWGDRSLFVVWIVYFSTGWLQRDGLDGMTGRSFKPWPLDGSPDCWRSLNLTIERVTFSLTTPKRSRQRIARRELCFSCANPRFFFRF